MLGFCTSPECTACPACRSAVIRLPRIARCCHENTTSRNFAPIDPPEPLTPVEEPDEPSDLDDFDGPSIDDDSRWDVFIPDDDERDPLPDPSDF